VIYGKENLESLSVLNALHKFDGSRHIRGMLRLVGRDAVGKQQNGSSSRSFPEKIYSVGFRCIIFSSSDNEWHLNLPSFGLAGSNKASKV
jgi:hypothetical protein